MKLFLMASQSSRRNLTFDLCFSMLQFTIRYIHFQHSKLNLLLNKNLSIFFQTLISLFFGSNVSFNTSNNGGKVRALLVNILVLFFKLLNTVSFNFNLRLKGEKVTIRQSTDTLYVHSYLDFSQISSLRNLLRLHQSLLIV